MTSCGDRGKGSYPSLAEYALISDCNTAALVSRSGSIDWCCLPRFDSPSVFGRLLDWDRGGHWIIAPHRNDAETGRRYLPDTAVLESTITTDSGVTRRTDCLLMRHEQGPGDPLAPPVILRVLEGLEGAVRFSMGIAARPDYGHVRPWVRGDDETERRLIGADQALVVTGDADLETSEGHDLVADIVVEEGDRFRVAAVFRRPAEVDCTSAPTPSVEELDRGLDETVRWWETWSEARRSDAPEPVRKSALVLRALTHEQETFDCACATTNDVGIFAEQFDPATGEPFGNLPQAISHLSHISAALALLECSQPGRNV